MIRRYLPLGACLATVALAACQEHQPASILAPAPAAASVAADYPMLDAATLERSLFAPTISADVPDLAFESAEPVINPNDYVCSASSPLNQWINASINNSIAVESGIFFQLYNLAADQLPVYEALYLQPSPTPQTYGYTGAFTHTVMKVERDVKGFWDIPSDKIQVVAMHGTMLLDTARVAATYRFVYGIPAPTASYYAAIVRSTLLQSQTMNGGNYPFFTFNAVSFRTSSNAFPPKIVMGDGILEGYEALGLGDVAPQAIFAHEYAHQIQFEKGYRLSGMTAAERTRYTELMADAMSAFYLTHKRGATMNRKRVEQFLNVFFQIGDCSFTSSGHHGTPNQRLAAARFGFSVADEAQKQGHILTAAQFYARFQAQYPTLIAPDAP